MKSNIYPSELYAVYQSTGTINEAAKIFGIWRGTASKILRNNGFKILPRRRKYKCIDDFFSEDTPESFYWAGFLAADGCVRKSKGNWQVKVNLSVRDTNHLEKFVSAVGFTGRMENVQWRSSNGVLVRITSRKMCKDLARFNILPRKTFTYKFPGWIKEHDLVNHFMRGYFDGDGSCWLSNPSKTSGGKTRNLTFEILGTKDFVTDYVSIIKPITNTKSSVFRKKNIWYSRISGNIANRKLANFLYQDANENILMNRKYERFAGIPKRKE